MANLALIPIPSNRRRYIVLMDVLPDLGPLAGYFQLALPGRMVNGFTTDSAVDIMQFLSVAPRTLAAMMSSNRTRNVYRRVSLVIMDRLAESALGDDAFTTLAAHEFSRRLLKHSATNSNSEDQVRRAKVHANVVARTVQSMVGRVPVNFQPQQNLLRGEDPALWLRKTFLVWSLNPSTIGASGQGIHPQNLARMNALNAFLQDPQVPDKLKNSTLSIDKLVEESLHRTLLVRADQAMVKIVGASPYPSLSRALGAGVAIDKFINKSMDGRLLNAAVTYVLENRVDYSDPEALDKALLAGVLPELSDEDLNMRWETMRNFQPQTYQIGTQMWDRNRLAALVYEQRRPETLYGFGPLRDMRRLPLAGGEVQAPSLP